ncbi:MAG TPA: hypothetical protein VGH28_00200 [Polyangiaceae bacterium]
MLILGCGASQPASVMLAPLATSSSTPASVASDCPRGFAQASGAACGARADGHACRYPEGTCVCREVAYCGGGVVRIPPPPDESIELACTTNDCIGAADGAPCDKAGVVCPGPACYSSLTCTAGRWLLEGHGPPP